jgi:hypothetical protein
VENSVEYDAGGAVVDTAEGTSFSVPTPRRDYSAVGAS